MIGTHPSHTCLNPNIDDMCVSLNLDAGDPEAELKLFIIFLQELKCHLVSWSYNRSMWPNWKRLNGSPHSKALSESFPKIAPPPQPPLSSLSPFLSFLLSFFGWGMRWGFREWEMGVKEVKCVGQGDMLHVQIHWRKRTEVDLSTLV